VLPGLPTHSFHDSGPLLRIPNNSGPVAWLLPASRKTGASCDYLVPPYGNLWKTTINSTPQSPQALAALPEYLLTYLCHSGRDL
jgi:hypothetical protein